MRRRCVSPAPSRNQPPRRDSPPAPLGSRCCCCAAPPHRPRSTRNALRFGFKATRGFVFLTATVPCTLAVSSVGRPRPPARRGEPDGHSPPAAEHGASPRGRRPAPGAFFAHSTSTHPRTLHLLSTRIWGSPWLRCCIESCMLMLLSSPNSPDASPTPAPSPSHLPSHTKKGGEPRRGCARPRHGGQVRARGCDPSPERPGRERPRPPAPAARAPAGGAAGPPVPRGGEA